ncbi:MAG: peptidoglycan DD-metalloendopeptidase family protein [Deltaproteobacteria bacterium]|nr:peptidoglycan DD-metalloendopeptidase family protein [Deltaproteobacteria bacterium]
MRAPLFLLILSVALALTAPAAAVNKKSSRQDVIRKEKKLEDVKKQIREEKKSVKTISEKETNILGDLETINKNLLEKREELRKVEKDLSEVLRKVSNTNGAIARLEREREALSERLKSRLKAMYKMRRGEYLSLIFSSESPRDLGRRHKYLTIIMDSDSNLISGYERNLVSLEAEKAGLKALYSELTAANRAALAKRNETIALQRQKTAFLSEIKREKDRRIKTISELEEAAAELRDLLNRLRAEEEKKESRKDLKDEAAAGASGFAAMRGKLRMPVDGTVVSFYGKVKHPKFQTVTFNNGIVIEAPAGAPVKSVYEGKVIYVGWLKGYGQVLIMDNGGGYYTLFANLSRVLKERGETAEKGTEVGLVGDTGASSTPGLYFEIRQKGVPRDPMAWFAER